MLSHVGRKDRIHVLTLDNVLATDLRERISFDLGTRDYEVIAPQNWGMTEAIAEIERMATHTVSSRLLIMDVRSYTLPRLRHAYNKIIGYNRMDLHCLCYTMLIGDGPPNSFGSKNSPDVFAPLLASHRQDYHAAVFFYDPFLHYTTSERHALGLDGGDKLPENMPQRLAKGYWKENVSMGAVRRYFRAGLVSGGVRARAKVRRQEPLARFFKERMAEQFPHDTDMHESFLCKEGYSLTGEALKLHVYPFFFEEWVSELMQKAKEPVFQETERQHFGYSSTAGKVYGPAKGGANAI